MFFTSDFIFYFKSSCTSKCSKQSFEI